MDQILVWDCAGRIEAARYKHEPQMLLEGAASTLALTNGDERRGAKRGRKKSTGGDGDDDDDDDEEEYRPEIPGAKKSKNVPSAAAHAAKTSGPTRKDEAPRKPLAGPQGQQARGLVKARRRADGVMEYKVRWHDCEKDADTWVDAALLPSKMIERYEKKMAEKKMAMAAVAAGPGTA